MQVVEIDILVEFGVIEGFRLERENSAAATFAGVYRVHTDVGANVVKHVTKLNLVQPWQRGWLLRGERLDPFDHQPVCFGIAQLRVANTNLGISYPQPRIIDGVALDRAELRQCRQIAILAIGARVVSSARTCFA